MEKKKGMRYVSVRVLLALGALALCLLGLLVAAWVLCLRQGWALWWCAVLSVGYAVLLVCLWHYLYRPYREIEKILELFATGYTFEGVFSLPYQLTPGVEKAIAHVEELVNTRELLSASKRQAQYLALQNQINPHFLYNTLEGIRGEALVEGNESIAMMTEALSTFFRYTISNVENLVSLEDELANVENYFIIQQYRFGSRLSLKVEFDSEEDKAVLLAARVPKLTLQPIVENAIVHGIEGKVGDGCVSIRVQGTGKRVIIMVRDDGLGMPRKQLDEMNQKLSAAYYDHTRHEAERRGGIAVVNVNNRIRLLFGEEYGIAMYSVPGQGTDVEITLPYMARGETQEAAK